MFRAFVAVMYLVSTEVLPAGLPIRRAFLPKAEQTTTAPQNNPFISSSARWICDFFRRCEGSLTRINYAQSNIHYNAVGQVTGYHQSVTQVERYTVYSEHMHGLRKKITATSVVGANTTDSDVSGIQYDNFGRQVHSVASSYDHGGKTQSRVESWTRTFDKNGHALKVDRTTWSHTDIPKSRGSFMARAGAGLLAGALLVAASCLIPGIGPILAMSLLCSGIGVGVGSMGAAAFSKGSLLGGKAIESNSTTTQTMAYKADGTVDEAQTKAQTQTLSSSTKVKGKDLGDELLTASDIVVAVGSVAATFASFGAATPLAVAMCSMAVAAVAATYNVERQGISTHDLEKHHDREGARQRAGVLYQGLGSVAVAGLGGYLKGLDAAAGAKAGDDAMSAGKGFLEACKASNEAVKAAEVTHGVIYAATSIVVNVSVASASGAKGKALWTVAAISVANGLMQGYAYGGGGSVLAAGGGELVRQVGMNYGPEKQRATWMVVGSAVQGIGGSNNAWATSGAKALALDLYAKNNSAIGGTDEQRFQQGFVVAAWSELGGTLMGIIIPPLMHGDIGGAILAPFEALATGARFMGTELMNMGSSDWSSIFNPTPEISNFSPLLVAPSSMETVNPGAEVNPSPANPAVAPTAAPSDIPAGSPMSPKSHAPATLQEKANDVIRDVPGGEMLNNLMKGGPSIKNLMPNLPVMPFHTEVPEGKDPVLWRVAEALDSGISLGTSRLLGQVVDAAGFGEEGRTEAASPTEQLVMAASASLGNIVVGGEASLGTRFDGLLESGKAAGTGNAFFEVKKGAVYTDEDGTVWEPGTKFELTADGLRLVFGTTMEDSYEGLKRSGGGPLPVVYQGGADGSENAVGIDGSRMAAGKYEATGTVKVFGFGTIYAGTMTVGAKGQVSFGSGSLYQGDKDKTATYVTKFGGGLMGLPATVNDGVFSATVDRLQLGDGQAMTLSGAMIKGTITDGTVKPTDGAVTAQATIRSIFGNASGGVTVKAGADGLTMEGLLKGRAAYQPGESGGKGGAVGSGGPAGEFMVTGERNGVYELTARPDQAGIPVTGSGIQAMTAGSKFNVREGLGFKAGEMTYYQNGASGMFEVDKDGAVRGAAGTVARKDGGDLFFFGVGGTVAARAEFDKNGVLKGAWTGNGTSLDARVEMGADGKGRIYLVGAGNESLTTTLLGRETLGGNQSKMGVTTVTKWVQRGAEILISGSLDAPKGSGLAWGATETTASFSASFVKGVFRGVLRNGTYAAGYLVDCVIGGATAVVSDRWDESQARAKLAEWTVGLAGVFEKVAVRADSFSEAQKAGWGTADALGQHGSRTVAATATLGGSGDMAGMIFSGGDMLTNQATEKYEGAKTSLGAVGGMLLQDALKPGWKSVVSFGQGMRMMVDHGYISSGMKESSDRYGDAVGLGLTLTEVGTGGMIVLGAAAGAFVKGRAAFAETTAATAEGFVRLSGAVRTMKAALSATKSLAIQGVENALPGFHVASFGEHLEMRSLEHEAAVNAGAAKDLGLEGAKGFEVVGVRGNKVTLLVNGEGARSPVFMEVMEMIKDRARQKGVSVDLGVMDGDAVKALKEQGGESWFMEMQSKRGFENIKMNTEATKAQLEAFRQKALEDKSTYEETAGTYRERQAPLEADLKAGEARKAAIEDLLAKNERKEVVGRDFVRQASEIIGGKEGRRLLVDFDRAQGSVEVDRRVAEESGGSGEDGGRNGSHVRPDGEGIPGADRRLLGHDSEVGGTEQGIESLVRKAEAERSAVGAERSAVGALNKELENVGSENEVLVKDLAGLREAESLARARAETSGARARALGEGIKKYDGALAELSRRIADPKVSDASKPGDFRITTQLNPGEANLGSMVRHWAEEIVGSNRGHVALGGDVIELEGVTPEQRVRVSPFFRDVQDSYGQAEPYGAKEFYVDGHGRQHGDFCGRGGLDNPLMTISFGEFDSKAMSRFVPERSLDVGDGPMDGDFWTYHHQFDKVGTNYDAKIHGRASGWTGELSRGMADGTRQWLNKSGGWQAERVELPLRAVDPVSEAAALRAAGIGPDTTGSRAGPRAPRSMPDLTSESGRFAAGDIVYGAVDAVKGVWSKAVGAGTGLALMLGLTAAADSPAGGARMNQAAPITASAGQPENLSALNPATAEPVRAPEVGTSSKVRVWASEAVRSVEDRAGAVYGAAKEAVRDYKNNTEKSIEAFKEAPGFVGKVRTGMGLATSNLSFDIWDRQPDLEFDPKEPILLINGVFTNDRYAKKEAIALKDKYGLQSVARVENNTHFVIGDIFQILGEELGAQDITVIRARDAIKDVIQKYGSVSVRAFSQGSAITSAALDMLTPEERSRVTYEGDGAQKYIDGEARGLKAATNVRYPIDPVAKVNGVLKYVGMRPWKQDWVELERNKATEDLIGHDFLADYVNGKRREDGQ